MYKLVIFWNLMKKMAKKYKIMPIMSILAEPT